MTRLVLGPCSSVGVQLKTPSELMRAPAGASGSRLKVSCWAGRSRSLAFVVKLDVLPSLIATVLSGKPRRRYHVRTSQIVGPQFRQRQPPGINAKFSNRAVEIGIAMVE